MRSLIAVAIAVLAFAPVSAGAEKAAFCKMTREDAVRSPICIRWFLACQMGSPSANPTGVYASLNYEARIAMLVRLTLGLAELDCEQFSYQEALAAARFRLMPLPNDSTTPRQ